MRLRILYDNSIAGNEYSAGWGFSCLINENLLFDTGEYHEILAHNMEQSAISCDQINKIVISHDHYDHQGGLNWVLSHKPGIKVYIGSEFSYDTLAGIEGNGGNICYADDWEEIEENIFLTRDFKFTYRGIRMSERGLVLKSEQGITLLTGCSHPGILDMITSVRKHFKNDEFVLAAGGFHLKDTSEEEIEKIVRQIEKTGVKKVAPTHCSGDVALDIFKYYYGNRFVYLGAGKEVRI